MGVDNITLLLLPDLKEYLRIDFDHSDKYLKKLMVDGMAWLNRMAGATLDYQPHDLPRTMLFSLVRYSYNDAIELFEENFASELLRMQLLTATGELPLSSDNS